jgi:hypothetical protein
MVSGVIFRTVADDGVAGGSAWRVVFFGRSLAIFDAGKE